MRGKPPDDLCTRALVQTNSEDLQCYLWNTCCELCKYKEMYVTNSTSLESIPLAVKKGLSKQPTISEPRLENNGGIAAKGEPNIASNRKQSTQMQVGFSNVHESKTGKNRKRSSPNQGQLMRKTENQYGKSL